MTNGPPTQNIIKSDKSQELIQLNRTITQVPIIKNFARVTNEIVMPERVVFKAIKPRNLA